MRLWLRLVGHSLLRTYLSFPFRPQRLSSAIIQECFLCLETRPNLRDDVHFCSEEKGGTHPLYPDLLFRLGHSQLESFVFLLPRRLQRLAQDSSTDPQIRRVLAIEGVIRLELFDLREVCRVACVSLGNRSEEGKARPQGGNPSNISKQE